MKDGKCPKCGSNLVYKKREGFTGHGPVGVDLPGRWVNRNVFATDAYVCANCAYLELYVADEETLQKLLENEAWKRVE